MFLTHIGIGGRYLHWCLKENHYTELFKPVEFAKDIVYLQLVMKHPHIWKYFYFDMVKDRANIHEWDTLIKKSYIFSEWYHTTPRSDRAYFCPITLEQNIPIRETVEMVGTLQKSYINGRFDRQQQNESNAIQNYVVEFVRDITEKLACSNKLFAATPILSGSVAEGTKVGLPDEYDFILLLHKLQDEFDLSKIKANLPSAPYLRVEMAESHLFTEYYEAFYQEMLNYEHSEHFFLHKIGNGISVRPFTFTLSYHGIFFKNLNIDIDLVPAFKISYQAVETTHHKIRQECTNTQILAVVKQAKTIGENLHLSFSFHERDELNSLSMCVKNGYCLAKAVRHVEVCPWVKVSGMTVVSVDEHVTTYMLKTCLLHVMKECEPKQFEDNEWLSPLSIKWAIKIYEQMKFFVEIFEGRIPSYFQPTADICSEFDITEKRGEHKEECNRRTQKIRLTFINYILQLLNKLLEQRLQV